MNARPIRAPGPASVQGVSTPHQRLFIRTMFGQLDLDTRYMGASHRRFFKAAKLPPPEANASIDAVLCGFTRAQASALIEVLRPEVRN